MGRGMSIASFCPDGINALLSVLYLLSLLVGLYVIVYSLVNYAVVSAVSPLGTETYMHPLENNIFPELL